MQSDKRKEYIKLYKEFHYAKTRKIVTFPLMISEFERLASFVKNTDMTPNTMSKKIVLDFLLSQNDPFLSEEQKTFVREYIRISRGIANNINQLAYKANIGEFVDIKMLFNELQRLENAFNQLIAKGGYHDH